MPSVREDVKIAFYEINKCGYYLFSKKKAQPFSNIKETLEGIYDWVHQDGTTLGQTLRSIAEQLHGLMQQLFPVPETS